MIKLICDVMIVDSGSVAARPRIVPMHMHNAKWLASAESRVPAFGREVVSSTKKRVGMVVSCVKASDAAVVDKLDGE